MWLQNVCHQEETPTKLGTDVGKVEISYTVGKTAANISMEASYKTKNVTIMWPSKASGHTPAGLTDNMPQRCLETHVFCCIHHSSLKKNRANLDVHPEVHGWRWRDDSVFQNTGCSSRGLGYNSGTLVPGDSVSPGLQMPQACMCSLDIHVFFKWIWKMYIYTLELYSIIKKMKLWHFRENGWNRSSC